MTAMRLDRIVLDPRCQCRESLFDVVVTEYMESLSQLPPVEVWRVEGDPLLVDGDPVLVDGFHRFAAHRRAKASLIKTVVVGRGTIEAAQWYALSRNHTHGLRRSNIDKRKAVGFALEHASAKGKSDRAIGEWCGVSNHLVALVRRDRETGSTEEVVVEDTTWHERAKATAVGTKVERQLATHAASTATTRAASGGPAKTPAKDPPPRITPQVVTNRRACLEGVAVLKSVINAMGRVVAAVNDDDAVRGAMTAGIDAMVEFRLQLADATPVSCPLCHKDDSSCRACSGVGFVRAVVAAQLRKASVDG
ncbi:MAG: hypothetical protein AAB426_09050 [Myxococcota bacterium]